jgi:hypothetical protein
VNKEERIRTREGENRRTIEENNGEKNGWKTCERPFVAVCFRYDATMFELRGVT